MIRFVKGRLFVIALMSGWAASAVAGEPLKITFELKEGKEHQVCVDYTKNLNSVQTNETISCVRPLNPQFEEFSKPTWKELDLSEHIDLYTKIREVTKGIKYKPPEEQRLERERISVGVRNTIARGGVALLESSFDINNDGEQERVIYVIDKELPCRSLFDERGPKGGDGELFGLDEDGQPVRNLHPLSMRSNAFFYDGRTFLDTWVFSRRGFEGVLVYESETAPTGEGFVTKVCRIFANY